ncbi:MAG: hypothetical protein HKO65_17550, partial [Gemmatimonadetes bacterium]|nr:hypothetical protein [Gemmatimonadota bacterium]
MWTLLHAPIDAAQSVSADLAILQMRAPTTTLDMVLGATFPTKLVLLVLLAFSLLSWWLIFWKWKHFRRVRFQGDLFLNEMEKAQTLDEA